MDTVDNIENISPPPSNVSQSIELVPTDVDSNAGIYKINSNNNKL